ncbi:RidA family protein [Caproiciproducens sp. NJN-50]|uniref:RidA family protein n=1 Tax=Acutalibacteraceae TaxID=3082771 RepID=UPI000FFE0740|nr:MULTISPECIES: RidA family protein [Acutalibacteraceae]QAT50287.1 RidA family protein [Caproiciproducens sp. NJN-50]
MTKNFSTKNAPAAIGPYSQAIQTGDTVYVSGQLPIDPTTGEFPSDDVKVLTQQALDNIRAILKEANMDLSNIVKTTVLLDSMSDFAAMNEVYGKNFAKPYPTRAAFEVGKLPKNAKLEIEVIAVR